MSLPDNVKEVHFHAAEENQKSLYKWAVKHFLKMLFLGAINKLSRHKISVSLLTVLCKPLSADRNTITLMGRWHKCCTFLNQNYLSQTHTSSLLHDPMFSQPPLKPSIALNPEQLKKNSMKQNKHEHQGHNSKGFKTTPATVSLPCFPLAAFLMLLILVWATPQTEKHFLLKSDYLSASLLH